MMRSDISRKDAKALCRISKLDFYSEPWRVTKPCHGSHVAYKISMQEYSRGTISENLYTQMIKHTDFPNNIQLHHLIKKRKINFAGNSALKIYGKLSCKSGKRMKKTNRVFFESEKEAITAGYRPCGHCMHNAYLVWKSGTARLRHK